MVDEIRKASFVKRQPDFGLLLVATWRLLSGFEHGFGWALLRGSDRTFTADIPGGAEMRFVINDGAFVNAAKATCFLLITACRVFRRRHLEPNGA